MSCYCKVHRISSCGDCGKQEFLFGSEDLEDIHSALTFFVRTYPERKKSPQTIKAMKKIIATILKMKKKAREE